MCVCECTYVLHYYNRQSGNPATFAVWSVCYSSLSAGSPIPFAPPCLPLPYRAEQGYVMARLGKYGFDFDESTPYSIKSKIK